MSWDQLFLMTLLLCSVIGLLHVMYYLGRIIGWAFCKAFIRKEKYRSSSDDLNKVMLNLKVQLDSQST